MPNARPNASAETITMTGHNWEGMPLWNRPKAAAKKPKPARPVKMGVTGLPGWDGSPPMKLSQGFESAANGQ